MSLGMTPYEFVQQVYYAQEKVILDFHPDDDKYKEVIMEGNFVIQELQKEEDWNWLREQIILGPCDPLPHNHIPEFELPDWVYKPAMLFDDCVRLHRADHHGHLSNHFHRVPWVSAGAIHKHGTNDPNYWMHPHSMPAELGAVWFGNTITFNRPDWSFRGHVAVTDIIRRMPLLHICNESCVKDENGKCVQIEDRIFTEVPDPSYLVIRTASLHAAGSPPAAPRAVDLADQAQKLLSAMRANDSAHTVPDIVSVYDPTYISVI